MKKILFLLLLSVAAIGQNPTKMPNGAVVGTSTLPASNIFAVFSNSKASRPAPVMTKSNRDAIASPGFGDMVMQSNETPGPYYYNGTEWVMLGGGGSGVQSIIPGNEFTLVDATDPQNPVVTAAQSLQSVTDVDYGTTNIIVVHSPDYSRIIELNPIDGWIRIEQNGFVSIQDSDGFRVKGDGGFTYYYSNKIENEGINDGRFIQNIPVANGQVVEWSYPTDETTATNASREWVLANAGGTTTVTGTTGEVDVAQPNPGEYVIGLPESVSIDELTVQGNLVVNGNPDFYGTPYFEQIPNFFAGVNPAQINQDATHRFATDAEKVTWNAKEPAITATTAADYYAGDKTFKPLNKAAVGLGNVDNTSDANKPVSTSQQTALNAKQDNLVSGTNIKTVGGESLLGSGNVKALVPILRDYNTYTGTAIATQQHLVSYPIQLNIDANGWIDIELEKSGTAGTMRIELWLGNTAGTMVGAQQIAVYTVAAGSRYLYQLHRSFRIDANGLARFRGPAQNMVTDAAVGTQADQVRNLTTTPPVQYLQVWATMQTAATDIPSVVEAVVVITK